jgi:hypothetical protein
VDPNELLIWFAEAAGAIAWRPAPAGTSCTIRTTEDIEVVQEATPAIAGGVDEVEDGRSTSGPPT